MVYQTDFNVIQTSVSTVSGFPHRQTDTGAPCTADLLLAYWFTSGGDWIVEIGGVSCKLFNGHKEVRLRGIQGTCKLLIFKKASSIWS